MNKEQQEHISEMISDIESARSCSNFTLNNWEEDFFDSVVLQFDETHYLSEKQIMCLIKIWEKI